MLLHNQETTEEVKKEIKRHLEKKKWQQKHYGPKPMGCSKSSSKMTTIYFKKQEVSDNLTLNWSKNPKFVAIKKERKEIKRPEQK